MRRLLYFGTGAAVIGIVLLLAAFYAAYSIVTNLQNELANNTNVNLVLEDATLEAVFLGIMAALGYALVSQGLSGIRREEMLEIESSVEGTVSMRDDRIRIRQPARMVPASTAKSSSGPRAADQGSGASPPSAQDAPAASSPAPAPQSSALAVQTSSESPSPPQPRAGEVPQFSWKSAAVEPRKPIEVPSPVVEASAAPAQEPAPSETPKVDAPAAVSAESAASPVPAASTAPEPSQTEAPNQVVWEGGPPPKLEGVDVLPEPPEHGVLAVEKQDEPGPTPGQDVSIGGIPQPPKRGRGRPKGSKNKKSDE